MISVVMPIYNHVEFLGEAISSILTQTYKDIELLLIDDGSIDGSSELAKSFLDKDKRIKYYYKENGGTGSALNFGFNLAKGERGTWVSSDNIYYPDMLEEFSYFMDNFKYCKFVFSGFNIDNSVNYLISKDYGIIKDFIIRSKDQCVTGICFLFDMDLKKECGDYILVPGEDHLMGVKMGLKTEVGYIPKILGMYRYHDKCLTYYLSLDSRPMVCKKTGKTSLNMVQELLSKR